MPYSAGTAFLQVVASFDGIEKAFRREVENLGRHADRAFADAIPNGMRDGMDRGSRDVNRQAAKHGEDAGERYAGAMGEAIRKRLAAMLKALPEAKIEAETKQVNEAIADVRKDLAELHDAHINLEVDSDFAKLELERIAEVLRKIERDAVTVEIRADAAKALAEVEAFRRVAVGAQEDIERAHRQAAIEDDKRAKERERHIRDERRMLDQAHAEDERRDRDRALMLAAAYTEDERRDRDKALRLNAAYAENERRDRDNRRMLDQAHAENERRDRDALRMRREAAAEDARFNAERARQRGGAAGEQVRRRLTSARDAIPVVEPHLQTRPIQAELQTLRAEIDRLLHAEIDVDIPADLYMADVARVEATLQTMETNTVNVPVDFDMQNIRAARAEINALTQQARRAGHDAGDDWGGSFVRQLRQSVRTAAATITDIPIGVNTTQAQFDIGALRARLVALGNVRIGVDMTLTEFLREVSLVENALADLEMDDVDIQTRLEAAATRVGLTRLHQQVNEVDRDDIEIDVDANTAGAALSLLTLQGGIAMSRLGALIAVGVSLGTALVPVFASVAASFSAIATGAAAAALGVGVFALGIFGVFGALQAMDKAQKNTTKSAVSLSASQARIAGAQSSVQSATRQLAKAYREEEQAVLDLARAREDARRQLEDMALAARSNALAQRQARLDEIDAKKTLDKLLENPRATDAEREQARITYEEKVLQIEELGIKQARFTADKAVADAKGIEGSDQVKAANDRIANAMEGVISAQESLANSQRSLAQAYEKTATAGGAAMAEMERALNALSPAGRRFAEYLYGYKQTFKELQHVAEGGLLPGLQEGLTTLLGPAGKPSKGLTEFRDLVGSLANTMGSAFKDGVAALKDPVWQKFFGYLKANAVPALEGMLKFTGNVATGLVGIFNALTGFNGDIGGGMLKWSENFAKWASDLDNNKGFQKFIQYVRDSAPDVLNFMGNLWDWTKKFVAAAAPIGEVVVIGLAKLFGWLDKIDSGTWTVIIGAIVAIATAMLVIGGITAFIGFLIGSLAAQIVLAAILIIAGLILLYTKVEWFRNFIDGAFRVIVAVAMWLWEFGIKPVFDFISAGVGVLVAVFTWLYEHVFVYTFGAIAIAFSWLSAVFQVFWGLIQIGMKIIGFIFLVFYTIFVKPFVDRLRPVFEWIGKFVQDEVVPRFRKAMENLGKAWDIFAEYAKKPLIFVVETLMNDGILKAYNSVAKFFKVKPDDVHIDLPKGWHEQGSARKLARGGAVHGPGTGTSDSIPAWLSDDEHVWTAKEVRALGGHGAMYRLRQMVLHGLAPGKGGVGDGWGWLDKLRKQAGDAFSGIKDFLSDPIGSVKKLAGKLLDLMPGKDSDMGKVVAGFPARAMDWIIEKVTGLLGSGEDGQYGPGTSPIGGSRGMMGILHAIFPGLRMLSGFRPNSMTLTGNRSYHAADRAVDVPPIEAVAKWLHDVWGSRSKELITPWQQYNIHNGQPHTYTGAVWMQHNFEGGNAHNHWAYDQGGYLPPGLSTVFNGTGRPEPVLTDQQWRDISNATRGGDGGSVSYNFAFRDTTLDPGRLRALQDREAALARHGRAR